LFDARDTASLFSADFEAELALQRSADTERSRSALPPRANTFDEMIALQLEHWLPDNMLLRQDKTGMASAIEARVPYLDHEIVEFALRLPRQLRLRRLVGKYLLRKLGRDFLPPVNARRSKMPFYVPLERYFGDQAFVEMREDLLSTESVRKRNVFRPEAVEALLRSARENEFIYAKQVFSLMTLELWFRIFIDGRQPDRC
jgi:asparagine synthase (glutamine-hydrolysing)